MVVASRVTTPEGPSGFGFELTFRLKRETGETAPPTWPAALMQALARYVFLSGRIHVLQHFTVNKNLCYVIAR